MKIINHLSLIALAVISTLVVSCIDHYETPNSKQTPPTKNMGRVQIHIAEAQARTFLPDMSEISSMVLDYQLTITKDGAHTPAVDETFSGNNWIGELESGEYTVDIIAHKSGTSQVAAQGTESFTVNKASTSSVNVLMTASLQGSGLFSYTINIAPDITITSGSIQFFPLSEGAVQDSILLTADNLSGNVNISSGYYRVALCLVDTSTGQIKTYDTAAAAHIVDAITTNAAYTITGDDFNQRNDIVTDSAGLNAAFAEIAAKPNGEYVILATGSFESESIQLGTQFRNKTITLQGVGSSKITIHQNSAAQLQGILFYLNQTNITLVLENITLQGISNNYDALVYVSVDSKLILKNGGKITGNTRVYYNTSNRGGAGVELRGGTLEIAGGEISENINIISDNFYAIYGGGVYAASSSTILMTGGAIRENSAINNNAGAGGGGIYLDYSSFEMTGGIIEGNTAQGATYTFGGGICLDHSSFEMTGGIIEGNTAEGSDAYGGGVCIKNGPSSFYFKRGTIRNNTCSASNYARGGGIGRYTDSNNSDELVMSGGIISGNNSTSTGDPVQAYGGGIYFYNKRLIKTGGIIYGNDVSGNDADGIPLQNTANGSYGSVGHAVNVGSPGQFRNTTAWEDDNLDSSIIDIPGGWHGNFFYVAYNANGGTGTMENSIHGCNNLHDTTFPFSPLSANAFYRTGYTFAGWAQTADGPVWVEEGAVISNYMMNISAGETLTLYAKWVP